MGSSEAIDFNPTRLSPGDTMFLPSHPQISAPWLNGKEPHPFLTQRDHNILYTYVTKTPGWATGVPSLPRSHSALQQPLVGI